MLLTDALPIAQKYRNDLAAFCSRCEIAGSIRREKPEVKDIEIVCIPQGKYLLEFKNYVEALYKLKGDALGKYTRRSLPEGIALDLFITTKEKWGVIFAIRTGSANYSHWLAQQWSRKGYRSENGILIDAQEDKYFFEEEEQLFAFLGVPFKHPKEREV